MTQLLSNIEMGQGSDFIVLHGLFGSASNWQGLMKRWAQDFHVTGLDLRNHGLSFHDSAEMNYSCMAQDVVRFMDEAGMHKVFLLGHSMGGKTAMQLIHDFPDRFHAAVIVDIAAKQYEPGHHHIFDAMYKLDLSSISSRQEADEQMSQNLPDRMLRQFILKNLKHTSSGWRWQINLDGIYRHYERILESPDLSHTCQVPTMLIRGAASEYILDSDIEKMNSVFSNLQVKTIENAGHWVHAQAPAAVSKLVTNFFLS